MTMKTQESISRSALEELREELATPITEQPLDEERPWEMRGASSEIIKKRKAAGEDPVADPGGWK